ncbi:MAG: hypothetical protein L7H00_04265 [Vulcanisaeta sp.]|nr:hypothetical protein [Vulcanisaeta sp.]
MVFGARLELKGGKFYEIKGNAAERFGNLGKFLFSEVARPTAPHLSEPPPYTFHIELFMPNHASVTLLPSTTISSEFKVELRIVWRRVLEYFASDGFGHKVSPEYEVILGRAAATLHYDMKVYDKNVLLRYSNGLIRYPTPPLISISVVF